MTLKLLKLFFSYINNFSIPIVKTRFMTINLKIFKTIQTIYSLIDFQIVFIIIKKVLLYNLI